MESPVQLLVCLPSNGATYCITLLWIGNMFVYKLHDMSGSGWEDAVALWPETDTDMVISGCLGCPFRCSSVGQRRDQALPHLWSSWLPKQAIRLCGMVGTTGFPVQSWLTGTPKQHQSCNLHLVLSVLGFFHFLQPLFLWPHTSLSAQPKGREMLTSTFVVLLACTTRVSPFLVCRLRSLNCCWIFSHFCTSLLSSSEVIVPTMCYFTLSHSPDPCYKYQEWYQL